MSSTTSSAYRSERAGHKRGISDAAAAPSSQNNRSSVERSPDHFYSATRHSLRPLPQAPASSPPSKRRSPQSVRTQSIDRYAQQHSEDHLLPVDEQSWSQDAYVRKLDPPVLRKSHTMPQSSEFVAPDLEELQKSSTGHLRALSRFAQSSESEEIAMTAPVPSVVGLQSRRQLKRTDSLAGGRSQNGRANRSNFAWERSWMDKQRQFLQAYEYLCHIGEAKEWIEEVIHKAIPPIVQLEEALRDGVTLAEIVQAICPQQPLRIFRNAKLQYRHSDNIATFFRFLEDVELPDLFHFELIDLYEKKNIPKVIYCIHALSWLLYRKGIIGFRIKKLVGRLEFDHHDLEQTQKGLDRAGVSMPSFAGMGVDFGEEPDPEPVETEDERVARELKEHEATILDLQTQAKGALLRMQLGAKMHQMWSAEDCLVDLQSRIRGDWARQVIDYRLKMQRFSVNLQASTRGFLARRRGRERERVWRSKEKNISSLQSLVRARKARVAVQNMKSHARREESGIKLFQAAVRGAMLRKDAGDRYEATRESEHEVRELQALAKGMLARHRLRQQRATFERYAQRFSQLQAASHGFIARRTQNHLHGVLQAKSSAWVGMQSAIRGQSRRDDVQKLKSRLQAHAADHTRLHASLRGAIAREAFHATRLALFKQQPTTLVLQSAAHGYLLRRTQDRNRAALQTQRPKITVLQALARGAIERAKVGEQINQLDDCESEIILLQGLIRAMLLRDHVGDLIAQLDSHEDSTIALQSAIRARMVRSRFAEKKRFFKENMEKVVKIQSVVRAKIQGEAYKSLTNGKNPPVGTLKGFVHLLNDSNFDFDEEIEFERLRKTVVQHVRQNELADQYIAQLDIKIALLVKNKITLDEVVKHQRHFGGHVGALLPNSDISSKDPFDLKALNKTSRRKLEHYQELFFLLQTQPHYLARLFRRIREHATAEKECERIKHVMMGLFGYAQKRREEYYLVKLIVRSLKEEVDGAQSLPDYLRTNSFWTRLFGAYVKSPRDRKFMRDSLGNLIKQNFIDNRELDLESDPMQIYLSAINNEELRTGQRSRRDPNVPREEAIRDPETRATFIQHMQDLRDIADQFFACIGDLLHKMPFGVRFVAQQMHEYLMARFQDQEPQYLLQLVGQWMWRNYFLPALTAPEKFGVVDRALTQEQKRNLGEVAKVLGQAVSGREFGEENVYLQPLNSYVRESAYRFSEMWNHGMYQPKSRNVQV